MIPRMEHKNINPSGYADKLNLEQQSRMHQFVGPDDDLLINQYTAYKPAPDIGFWRGVVVGIIPAIVLVLLWLIWW